jgi:inosine-uridine nucleoside N-ribohydrolase
MLARDVYVMGGAFNAPLDRSLIPSEFDGTQEVNIWGDPAAPGRAQAFSHLPVHMVAVDATSMVPVRPEIRGAPHRRAAQPGHGLCARLMSHPLLVGATAAGQVSGGIR